jgi:hypothetical protein
MKKFYLSCVAITVLLLASQFACRAWDYEGHRYVNQLALVSLPADFPAFVKTPEAQARIAFLAGEPDRWRDTPDLNHDNAPDHYIDLEELADYGIDEHHLTHYRYDFVAQLALARAAHPDKFPPIDPAANRDHTRQLVGLLPWAIVDSYDKLKSAFSYLKAFQKEGTPTEVANAEQNAIYIMGVMGHYVGDAAQPLHTTKYFNGWVGENPEGYTHEKIHSHVDGYFRNLDHESYLAMAAKMHPAELPHEPGAKPGDTFDQVMEYILAQNKKVAPLYQLEKEGKLFGEGDAGREGKEFLSNQLIIGGQMLGDLWYAAWQSAPEDTYLEGQLNRRKLAHGESGH